MTTLITGATGRVGRELLKSMLEEGERVRAFVLPDDPGLAELESDNVDIVTGTLTDRSSVAEAIKGASRVAHLAAVMLWDAGADRALFDHNITGTFNLLDAVREQGSGMKRFFIASSDEVYPSLMAKSLPIGESHPLNPYSFYGLTKEINERFAFYYHRAHDIPVTVARFALTARAEEVLRPDGWSGRFLFVEPMRGLLSALGRPEAVAAIDSACSTDPSATLLLALDEDGAPYEFHMCDVRDLVAGINLMLDKPSAVGQVFNLSGPEPFSYRDAVEALHSASGLPIVETRIPGPPIRIAHDIVKARAVLGYAPVWDIRSIIGDAAREFSGNRAE